MSNPPFAPVRPEALSDIVNWRHATKDFDPSRKISEDQADTLKTVLRMAPSSVNLQPWHFVFAATDDGKDRVARSGVDENHPYNKDRIRDCSHVAVIAGRLDAEETYLNHLLNVEQDRGRFDGDIETRRSEMKEMRAQTIHAHDRDAKDLQHWMDKQVYIALGQVLLAAASMGIDSAPMEGFDAAPLDEEFGLREKGYSTLAIVCFGYRGEDDYNADLPKARLPMDEIITDA